MLHFIYAFLCKYSRSGILYSGFLFKNQGVRKSVATNSKWVRRREETTCRPALQTLSPLDVYLRVVTHFHIYNVLVPLGLCNRPALCNSSNMMSRTSPSCCRDDRGRPSSARRRIHEARDQDRLYFTRNDGHLVGSTRTA